MHTRSRFLRAAGAFALSTSATLGHAAAQDAVPIKIATPTNDTATSAVYALKSGLFHRNGLDVEIEPMNSGSVVAAAVAGGAVSFGNSSLVTIIEAHAKNIPFTLVATSGMLEDDVPYAELIVRKDAPYRNARDLNGKTFAVPGLRDIVQIAAMAWIDKNGGDSTSVKFIELAASATVQAIADGRVDAGILGTPYLTAGVESGSVRVFANPYDAISPRFIQIAWFTLEDYANAHRDVVDRFAHAMRDASIYCNAHQAETLPMIVEFSKVDPKLAARMARVRFPVYLTGPLIQPLVDVAAKYKAIDKPFPAQELISPYALKPPR